jgi:uncharacterized protein
LTAADSLLDIIGGYGRLAVAYSGGADSALVLAAAARVLGPGDVLAVTGVSESLASGELAPARAFAESLGVEHLTPRTHELGRADYRANSRDRCYFCKSEVLDTIVALAGEQGFDQVATGTNADDAADPFRPGIAAGRERGIRTPLLEAGLTKAKVREISRMWSLPTWDKPATPCLASRVRHGIEVTPYRLARIDRAETAVRVVLAEAGILVTDLRVRDLGAAVRVEVPAADVQGAAVLTAVQEAVEAAGFDVGGFEVGEFRSGRLNEA